MTDILDLIDNALDDYATSCDAMRWSPAPDHSALIDFMASTVNPEASRR